MHVSIDDRWQDFVDRQVEQGRHASAREVIEDALRRAEQQDLKMQAFRNAVEAALDDDGDEGLFLSKLVAPDALGTPETKKLQDLRTTVADALAEGGAFSVAEVNAHLDQAALECNEE